MAGFPATHIMTGDSAYRIYQARDPATGAARAPYYFSSAGHPGAGRFDVPTPNGSCYFSDRRYGAWLEVFRQAGLVDRADVERRRMLAVVRSGPRLRVANLRAPGARPFGVTADLIGGNDYTLPQAWSAAILRARFRGLIATVRHDPTHTARTLILFARAGAHEELHGWRGATQRLSSDLNLFVEFEPFGTGIVDRPYDVVVDPPS